MPPRWFTRQYVEEAVLNCFLSAGTNGSLDKLLHEVSAEESDGLDLVSLIFRDMSRKSIARALVIFRTYGRTTRLPAVVVSDVDNTIIENSTTGDCYYDDMHIIPGAVPLMRAFSGDGATTQIFLSARPRVVELISRRDVKRTLVESGITRFAFTSGTTSAVASFVFTKKSKMMASAKADTLRGIRKLFPHQLIVFFGDDTQGDAIAAEQFVQEEDANSIAYILSRRSSDEKKSAKLASSDRRVIYHSGYYEAIFKTPFPEVRSVASRLAISEAETRSIRTKVNSGTVRMLDYNFFNYL